MQRNYYFGPGQAHIPIVPLINPSVGSQYQVTQIYRVAKPRNENSSDISHKVLENTNPPQPAIPERFTNSIKNHTATPEPLPEKSLPKVDSLPNRDQLDPPPIQKGDGISSDVLESLKHPIKISRKDIQNFKREEQLRPTEREDLINEGWTETPPVEEKPQQPLDLIEPAPKRADELPVNSLLQSQEEVSNLGPIPIPPQKKRRLSSKKERKLFII